MFKRSKAVACAVYFNSIRYRIDTFTYLTPPWFILVSDFYVLM